MFTDIEDIMIKRKCAPTSQRTRDTDGCEDMVDGWKYDGYGDAADERQSDGCRCPFNG